MQNAKREIFYILKRLDKIMKRIKIGLSLVRSSLLAELTLKTKRNFAKPTFLKFSPTYRCDSRCIMCDSWRMKPERMAPKNELTLSEIDKLFTEARKLGVYFLTINGGVGEPLMRKDIVDILKIAQREGFAHGIVTNGLRMDRDLAVRILSTEPFKIHVSLDGATEATHDRIRGIKGSFKKTVNSLKTLCEVKKELGVGTRIHTDSVIMGINLHEILDIVKLVESVGAEFLCQPVVIPNHPSILEIKDELWIEKDKLTELEKIIDELKKIKRNRGIILNTYQHLDMIKIYFKNPESLRFDGVCIYPLISLSVYPHGDVRTCLRKIGNIRDQSLTSIWKSVDVTKQNFYCKEICITPCYHIHDQIINFFYEDAILPILRKLKFY